MNKLLLVFLLLMHSMALFGQQTECSWLDQLKSSEDINEQLTLLQQNFGNCILVVVDGAPVSSDTSMFHFVDLALYIQMIRKSDVDSVNFLEGIAAKTLYGTAGRNGVMVISFKGERTKYRIRRRVIRELRKKN